MVALVYIVVKVSEGQYSCTTITSPDGTITKLEKCSGIGSCGVRASIIATGEKVSSGSDMWDYAYEGIAFFARDIQGNILLGIDKNGNEEAYNRFFYADNIIISRPFIIDNPNLLQQLGVTDAITTQGEYIVHTPIDNIKYIVIKAGQ